MSGWVNNALALLSESAWANAGANLASLLGVAATLYVALRIGAIRRHFRAVARTPELRSLLSSHVRALNQGVNAADVQALKDELARCLPTLAGVRSVGTLRLKRVAAETQKQIDSILRFGLPAGIRQGRELERRLIQLVEELKALEQEHK